MSNTFEITHDRGFLQHFLTRWRALSISERMVETLRAASGDDPYAAYGYGRWLSMVNPQDDSLKQAETLLMWAGTTGGVQDANAALAELYYDGRTEADKAIPGMHAFLLDSSYKLGSELAQFNTLEHTIYGEYGFEKNPAIVADILRGHIEKNPGCDPIYYDLWGQALEEAGLEGAEDAYKVALEKGEIESYYSLAALYRTAGDWEKACRIAEEGARKGTVNCHRFKAVMNQEDFLKLSKEEQETLHREIVEGLDYAIARHDRYACYLKGLCLYCGNLGMEKDPAAAFQAFEEGCRMGQSSCYGMLAAIHHDDEDILPPELRLSPEQYAKLCLQAARTGNLDDYILEPIACAYVAGQIPSHAEEIEQLWLKKFVESGMAQADDNDDATGVMAVYPRGFYYAMDVDAGPLDLDELAGKVDADGFDVVHFSPVLTRLTKAIAPEGKHIAMLVDTAGYAKDLPDNMPGTIIYGQGAEIRGAVVFVLEDDKDYTLMPMEGLQRVYMFLQLLTAASGNLIRKPSTDELKSIGADVDEDNEEMDGFEEYDDPDFYDDPDIFDGYDKEQEIEEDMVSVDTSDDDGEPREISVGLEELEDAIGRCNLCRDTLFVTLPDDPRFAFARTDDLFYDLGIKSLIEKSIECHGGYMIDEWQYVDKRQTPMDIRSRVRFK